MGPFRDREQRSALVGAGDLAMAETLAADDRVTR